jgi:hypothetical protein
MRSKQAAQIFQQLTEGKKIVYSLKGGIASLKNVGLIFSKKY